jgi:hypothetical protein
MLTFIKQMVLWKIMALCKAFLHSIRVTHSTSIVISLEWFNDEEEGHTVDFSGK